MPQAMKIPDAKATVAEECENLEKLPAWQLTKVSNQNLIVAKFRPTAMNLTSIVSTSSSSVNHPIASTSPGYSKHLQGNLTRGQEESQNPTQRRVLKEAYFGGLVVEVAGKPAATDKSQESWGSHQK